MKTGNRIKPDLDHALTIKIIFSQRVKFVNIFERRRNTCATIKVIQRQLPKSMVEVRTVKIQFNPTQQQKQILDSALWNSRRLYNLLVEQLTVIRNRAKRISSDVDIIFELVLCGLDINIAVKFLQLKQSWRNPYLNILRPGWATEFLRSVEAQKGCTYPKALELKKVKSGKNKGKQSFTPVIRTPDGKKNASPSASGVPGQSLGLIAQSFEASIKSCFTHWRNGNYDAKLPRRYKSSFPLPISNQQIKVLGHHVYQFGAGKTTIALKLPELARFNKIADAKFSRSRSGNYHIFVSGYVDVEVNPQLNNVAAIDFGQKRAIVISTVVDGKTKTAMVSGKNILGLKRERDRRYRELNRKRARTFRGHLRQYLSAEERNTCRRLQQEDNQRQIKGKKRTGADQKYAHRLINQRRREGVDGKGRRLVDLNQAPHDGICKVNRPDLKLGVLRKYSKQNYKLKRTLAKVSEYYRLRLTYANHCITRTTVDWAIAHDVGKIYVGDLDSLPKGRKKGKRRVKQVSRNNLWEMPTQKKYLEEKLILAGSPFKEPVEKHHERLTSQTCPVCQSRTKSRNRVYRCRVCHWIGDRDGLGSTNLLSLIKTGSCGNIMPDSIPRTLPIAPAIGQRIPMHRVAHIEQSNMRGGSAEASVPILTKSTISVLQASAIVDCCEKDGLTETLVDKGRRRKETGSGCMNNSASPISREFLMPVGDSQTAKSGAKSKSKSRSLSNSLPSYIQLTLWDVEV